MAKKPYSILSFDNDAWWFHLKYVGAPEKEIEKARKKDVVLLDGIKNCLSELEKSSLKATFFSIGSDVERYPEQHKAIAKEGHEIGSHSYTHPHPFSLSREKFRDELIKTEAAIKRTTGVKVKGFRAPSYQISEAYLQVLGEMGYRYDTSVISLFYPGYSSLKNAFLPRTIYHPSPTDMYRRGELRLTEFPISGLPLLPLTGTVILNLGMPYFKAIFNILRLTNPVFVINFHIRDFIELPSYRLQSANRYSKTANYWGTSLKKKLAVIRPVFDYLSKHTRSITYSDYLDAAGDAS